MKNLIILSLALTTNMVFAQTATVPESNIFYRFLNTPITKETVTTGAERVGGVIMVNKMRLVLGTMAVGE